MEINVKYVLDGCAIVGFLCSKMNFGGQGFNKKSLQTFLRPCYRVSNKKVPKGPGPLRDARFFASGCYRQEELKTSFSSQFVFVYLSKQNK